jgi:hypothetical protein
MTLLHSMAWSEPLFLALGFLGLAATARYLETGGRWALAGAAALLGAACLTRYAGLAFLATGVVSLALFGPGSARGRLGATLALGALGLAPLAAWFAHNQVIGGTTAGRALALHPVGTTQAWQALNTLAGWLLVPPEAGTALKLAALAVFTAALAGVVIWQRARQPGGLARAEARRMAAGLPAAIKVLLALVPVYGLFLLASISLVDANTPLDDRILSPVYLAGVAVAGYALQAAWPGLRAAGWPRLAVAGALLVFAAVSAWRTGGLAASSGANGIGFYQTAWRQSPTLALVRALPETAAVYTNAPEAVYLHTGRAALRIPRQFSAVEQAENEQFEAELAAMTGQLAGGGRVVYFASVRGSARPTEAELAERLGLEVVARPADGTLYALPQEP